jgi:hypothetical protein
MVVLHAIQLPELDKNRMVVNTMSLCLMAALNMI